MKRTMVFVPWREGLHLRHAASLVRVARGFRSTICLQCSGRIADMRSVLSIIALCATMGAGLVVEVTGEDEQDATQAIERVFSPQPDGGASSGTAQAPR